VAKFAYVHTVPLGERYGFGPYDGDCFVRPY
jgi:hypothetical protein